MAIENCETVDKSLLRLAKCVMMMTCLCVCVCMLGAYAKAFSFIPPAISIAFATVLLFIILCHRHSVRLVPFRLPYFSFCTKQSPVQLYRMGIYVKARSAIITFNNSRYPLVRRSFISIGNLLFNIREEETMMCSIL